MKKKKIVSIIIPTHNRHGLLKRAIYYFESKKFDFCNFIIIDSSTKTLNYKLKKNFKYIRFSKNNFCKKILFATKKVKTKYLVINNDDDFLSLNGLNKGLNFLENNKDFVSYHGEYISFRYLDKINKVIHLAAYSDTLKCDLNFNDSNKLSRVKKIYLNRPHWYNALHYTKYLKKSYELSSLARDSHFSEILIPFVVGLYGKFKVDKLFWYAKDSNIYLDETIRNKKAIRNMSKEIFIRNSRLKNKLVELAKINKLEKNNLKNNEIVDEVFKIYFKRITRYEDNKFNYYNDNLLKFARNTTPEYIKNIIRLFINYIKNGNIENTNENLKFYGPTRNKQTADDWEYMKRVIKSFTNFKGVYKNIV